MRIFRIVLVTLVPVSSVLAQGAAESAKTETLVLKAQTVELESLKADQGTRGEDRPPHSGASNVERDAKAEIRSDGC